MNLLVSSLEGCLMKFKKIFSKHAESKNDAILERKFFETFDVTKVDDYYYFHLTHFFLDYLYNLHQHL